MNPFTRYTSWYGLKHPFITGLQLKHKVTKKNDAKHPYVCCIDDDFRAQILIKQCHQFQQNQWHLVFINIH